MRVITQEIFPPANCPACGSLLEWEKDQLFCVRTNCGGRTHKMVEHFAKTLKIKGLGPRTIEKLEITSIFDLFQLPLELMIGALNSEKLAVKLYREIESSKNTDLVNLLPAFSIKLIGRTASTKICEVIESLDELTEQKCAEAGLGPKATNNLLDWLIEEYTDGYDRLPFSYKTKVKKKEVEDIKGIVCISGKLKSYSTKAAAKKILETKGFIVKSSLTKDVNFLVNESGIDSAKTRTAQDRGVTIITNLNHLIRGQYNGIT